MKLFIFFFISMLLNGQGQALVTFGTYGTALGKYQDDDQGSTQKFQMNPYFGLQKILPIPGLKDLNFVPELGLTFHRNTTGYSKKTISLLFDIGWQFPKSSTYLLSGLGVFWTKIKGDGETVTLADGGGTSEFYRPEESSTAKNAAFNLGVLQRFRKLYGVKFETSIMKALNSDEREINYFLTLNYYP